MVEFQPADMAVVTREKSEAKVRLYCRSLNISTPTLG
jgi:hypothetical protein